MRFDWWTCGLAAMVCCALGCGTNEGAADPARPGGQGVLPAGDGSATPGAGTGTGSDVDAAGAAGTAGGAAPAPASDATDAATAADTSATVGDGTAAPTTDPGTPAGGDFDYGAGEVRLDADLIVPAGSTVRVGPGARFVAASGVSVRVAGTLVVEGSAEAPASFLGAGVPRSWEGIVVEAGGHLEATHIVVGGATYGIHALPGASFTVDRADLGTSFKAAVVQSEGSFDHTSFHASGDPTFSISSAAPITDPNGTLTIVDASPTVSNSSFDSGAPLVDMVRVRGDSSPVFDHVYITDAHCGIHMEGGPNNSPVVTNAIFDTLAYGVMAYATRPVIEDSVFMNNASDVGFCLGATADNVPQLANNYYSAGAPLFDPSCVQIGTADAAPASDPNPVAGPVGL